MSKAILVRKSDHAVVGGVIDTSRAQWIVDPESGKKLASPATIGWGNDDWRLCALVEFVVPDGKQIAGKKKYWYDGKSGKVLESAAIEDNSPRRLLVAKRVIVDRLNDAGLLEAARQALEAAPLYDRERWNAREYIFADDPAAVALVREIGGKPEEILAVAT